MGFWDIAKRMAQGKPAFEVPVEYKQEKDEWEDTPGEDAQEVSHDRNGHTVQGDRRIGRDGQKVIAEAEVIEVKPRYSGSNVELWVTIRNNSQFDILLDKIVALGTSQELDYPLPPGGMRDLMIYNGSQLRTNGYKYAELYYRDHASGDYFCATHMIVYDHESDGTYNVTEMRLVRPIKDV